MLMLRLFTVIVSVPNALPETVKLWFCSKMASHSARADQLPAKAHSTPRPTVALDLDCIDRELLDESHRRIAGTETVDR